MERDNDTPAPRQAPCDAGAPLPAALADAYRRAIYAVDAPGGEIRLAVGEPNAALDRLLAASGVSSAAWVSAENPRSRPLSAAENRERSARLHRRLETLGLAWLPGESRSPSGDWREASCLVFGLELPAALELGREFGQAAILFVKMEKEVQLVAV